MSIPHSPLIDRFDHAGGVLRCAVNYQPMNFQEYGEVPTIADMVPHAGDMVPHAVLRCGSCCPADVNNSACLDDRIPMSSGNQSASFLKGDTSQRGPACDPGEDRLDSLLDDWCFRLKRTVLAEFSQEKMRTEKEVRKDLLSEVNRLAVEKSDVILELDRLKEYVHSAQQTMRRKDDIISNLSSCVCRQRGRVELARMFFTWREQHVDAKWEAFAMQLAHKHRQRVMCKRVIRSWFSIIHTRWRQRVEKVCQAKAQEVCLQITADYEAKVAGLDDALQTCREQVCQLQVNCERQEESMRKAFMRGVCALNMEAMTMFKGHHHDPTGNCVSEIDGGDVPDEDCLDTFTPVDRSPFACFFPRAEDDSSQPHRNSHPPVEPSVTSHRIPPNRRTLVSTGCRAAAAAPLPLTKPSVIVRRHPSCGNKVPAYSAEFKRHGVARCANHSDGVIPLMRKSSPAGTAASVKPVRPSASR